MRSASQRFRDLLAEPDILVTPGVYDGFSARLAQAFGFKAASITGAGLSESNLGWADLGIMGYEENLRSSAALAACVDIPLSADGDTGYGNAVNVYFTVQGFERAGLACLMIEDQVWPKRCGHMAGKEVISAEEGVEKIRAAVEARKDSSFVIKARTDAAGPFGIAEAIRRLNLYAEAGADLLVADAVTSAEHIALVAREVSKPLAVNMGFGLQPRSTTPLLSARRLQDMGVKTVSYPRLMTSAAIKGMQNALSALQQQIETGEIVERPELQVSFQELNELMGIGALKDIERRFLTAAQMQKKYGA
jgi:2-methylisocitrate lyase-like PEP mutase family enzyme